MSDSDRQAYVEGLGVGVAHVPMAGPGWDSSDPVRESDQSEPLVSGLEWGGCGTGTSSVGDGGARG